MPAQVPTASQERVLRWGILGAIVMRALMISAGAVMIQSFHHVLLIFAAVLIYQGLKIVRGSVGDDSDDSDETDLGDSLVLRIAQRIVPVSGDYSGDAFFVQRDGQLMATPLLLVLVVIEMSDVVFAIDSVPAAFGSSEDPVVIFTANMFAILSLRSLYAVVAHAVDDLPYLETAIGGVLVFLGTKMLAESGGIAISTTVSLSIVFLMLGLGAGGSFLVKSKGSWTWGKTASEIKHI
jgi:TerC family integral membrane protein